jgi:hypothetical protein
MGAWHCCNSLCALHHQQLKKSKPKKNPKPIIMKTKAVGKKNSVTYLDKANFAL